MELKLRTGYYSPDEKKAFNRTLWNWNDEEPFYQCRDEALLIEPYGIEMEGVAEVVESGVDGF